MTERAARNRLAATKEYVERSRIGRFMRATRSARWKSSTAGIVDPVVLDAVVRDLGVADSPYERVLDSARGIQWPAGPAGS